MEDAPGSASAGDSLSFEAGSAPSSNNPEQTEKKASPPASETPPADATDASQETAEESPVAPTSEGGLLNMMDTAPPASNETAPLSNNSEMAAPLSNATPASSTAFSTPVPQKVNDAALQAWRSAHNEKLKSAAAASQKQVDEELGTAKKELDTLYADWDSRKKSAHEKNVAAEKKFMAERDVADSGKFKNVGRYVDLKGLEASVGEKDVSRMREVLVRAAAK